MKPIIRSSVRIFSALLACALLCVLLLCGCGQREAEPAGRCTVSISCQTILSHMDDLTDGKAALVPADGVLLPPTEVSFSAEETAFDLLQRVCREHDISMESSWSPLYNSAYIEGVGNLYEFDCGALSGWMYSVNGAFPNYGCSRYALRDGDVICWVYTCDLGQDVGGGQAVSVD